MADKSQPGEDTINRRTVLIVSAGGLAAAIAASLVSLLSRRAEATHASAPGKGTEVARITRTPTPTDTPTPTPTPTATDTPTSTATPTPTDTPTPTSTPTSTLLPTSTPMLEETVSPAEPPPAMPMTIAYRGAPDERKVAITIDDFDSAVVWPEALAALRRNPDVRVTLFPIGRNIPRLNGESPGIWRGLLDAGHEIGYHSLEHTRLAGATVEQLRDEISRFNALVAEAVGDPGFRVRYCRAPFGDHGDDPTNFRVVAAEMGVIWVLWQTTPSWVTFEIDAPDSVRNGDISLFHDRWQDYSRLEPYMQVCRERGFEMVSLSGLRLIGD